MSSWHKVMPEGLTEQIYFLKTPEETFALGKMIGSSLQAGDVLALTGDLGSGKTTFVKGLGSVLGIAEPSINSPTFTYLNVYEGQLPLYHFDLYRLRSPKEFLDAGFADFLTSGIACIEWPQHAFPFLPENTLHLSFTHVDLQTRKIEIRSQGDCCEKSGI